MPDWKKDWPSIVYKLIMAILAIVLGYNQYQTNVDHDKLYVKIEEMSNHSDCLYTDIWE